MKNLFQTIKLEGNWWATFIVSPINDRDRYMVTSTLDKKADADHFTAENMRLANLWREQFNQEASDLKDIISEIDTRSGWLEAQE